MSVISQELQAVDKQVLALKLRQGAASYEDIAKACGYKSGSGAYQAIKSALKKTLQEPAEQLRKLELARLDAAQMAIWKAVQKGNLKAIDRFLKISKQRCDLLGLNAPLDVNLNGEINHSVTVDDIEEVRAKRWQQIQGQLLSLPDGSETFQAIEIDPGANNETVRNENVTSG